MIRSRPPDAAGVGAVVLLMLAGSACTSLADQAATTTGAVPAPVPAVTTTFPVIPEAVPVGATLIDERFEGVEAAGWAGIVGWAPIGYGEATGWSAAGPAWAWYPAGEDWTDYAVSFSGRLDAGALAIGVRAGPEGRYVVRIGSEAVELIREAPWGAPTTLAAAAPLEPSRDHEMSVASVGGHLQMWADGRLILEHLDLDPLSTGTVTLGAAAGSLVWVDRLRVSGLGAPLPAANPATQRAAAGEAPGASDAAPAGGPFAGPVEEPTDPSGGNDLEIGVVRFDRADYSAGDPIVVSADVLLKGEGPVGPFAVRFDAAGVECTAEVQSLSNFGSTVVGCTTPAVPGSGLPVWRLEVDHLAEVDETDEDDNAVVGALAVAEGDPGPVVPDLVVMWWATVPVWPPDPDEPVAFELRVGPLPPFAGEVPGYTLAVSLDGAALCDIEVTASQPVVVECPLDTGIGAGRHVLGVVVDVGDAVEEGAGEAGNSYEVIIDL